MNFLSGLFGRKATKKAKTNPVSGVEVDDLWNHAAVAQDDAPVVSKPPVQPSVDDEFEFEEDGDLNSIEHVVGSKGKAADASVNIWDMEEGAEEAKEEAAAPNRASARARRNRTRLIGFDKSDGDVVDLFEDAPKAAATGSDRVQFPVGWVLVMAGPGRGHCFPLVAGMSQIGRGDDQAVSLDFGDSAVSRNNHAAIVLSLIHISEPTRPY